MNMYISSKTRRRAACLTMLAAALGAGACKDMVVPDYNRVPIPELINSPNRTLVDASAAGLLHNARRDAPNRVRVIGVVGREAYVLDTNEPRNVTELVTGNIDPSSFTGNHDYNNPYGTLAQGQLILAAIDKVPDAEYTAAQREGLRGFTYTMMGNDLLIIAYMHQYGPTEVNADPLAPPAPMKTQAEMYARAAVLLDSGVAHLKAAGSTFSFQFPSGFNHFATKFDTPLGFLRFNRAIRARLDLLRKDYAAELIHLDSTWVTKTSAIVAATADTSRDGFNLGVYYNYSLNSGELPNTLGTGSTEVAEPTLKDSAQKSLVIQVNATDTTKRDTLRDARYILKVDSGAARTQLNITSRLRFALYKARPFWGSTGQNSPIPWVRNEQMILDRAEARWFTGDKANALADLNFVRRYSGKLAPIAMPASDAEFVTKLLYERRYSLMYEGGWRWLDLRRFGLLSTLDNYPRAGDKSITYWPVPFSECLARGGAGSAPGC
jgi:starch-binding outer membrane protein, SusD/RagB family